MAKVLEFEVEVKSSADKFWGAIRDFVDLFPKIFPDQYKSIDILEGDGKSVGSIRLVKYAEGLPIVTFSKEKIEVADETNMILAHTVVKMLFGTIAPVVVGSGFVINKIKLVVRPVLKHGFNFSDIFSR